MYLIQSHQLKARNIGKTLFKLPPLETIDRIHFSSLTWGVILFSFGLLTGIFSAENIGELKHVLKDPKVSLSLVACVFLLDDFVFPAEPAAQGAENRHGNGHCLHVFVRDVFNGKLRSIRVS
jgi:hypothetical protein